jgi:hypothetical protein
MTARSLSIIVAMICIGLIAWPVHAPAQGGDTGGGAQAPDDLWPRVIKLASSTVVVYQPQLENWKANRLSFRAAVGITPAGAKEETFGVIWGSAQTHVDRVARMVTFTDLRLTKSDFPQLSDKGAAFMRELQTRVEYDLRTIALDRIEASLAASGAVKPVGVPVNNTPPRILISYSQAILIPIDGNPVLRPVPGTRFERVINTQALILREIGNSTFYLHVFDGWLYAGTLGGLWYKAMVMPQGIDAVAAELAQGGQVDLLDGGLAQPKPSLAGGTPAIYVSETPTELIVFKGQPELVPVEGTALRWASNTAADVFFYTADRNYYILVSGRWCRAAGLNGPWSYVASTSLPADFRRIPAHSPAGVVLASVAGTPQAQEAIIANSIPQTATVPRSGGPAYTQVFDGPPQFRIIEGTSLEYVVNSPVPVIRVNAASYYALQAGLWFYATSPGGPWVVATSVPAAIYGIPATSPLHYVTYAYVYGSTANVVYVGYTPGYMGTVVTPDGVVVYGTGYTYTPYIGATVWYAPPVTYGVMAQPVYNPAVGMTYGFAMGVATASVVYAPYYHPAYYGGYPCCGSASANVYGQYGSTAYSGTRTYSSSPGAVSTTASGTYKNTATGTTGSYEAGRSYNTSTGVAQQGYGRTYTTTGGTTGTAARGESYNTQTGTYSTASSATATGTGGRSASASGGTTTTASGQETGNMTKTTSNANTGITKTTSTTAASGAGAEHQTTVTDSKTGQTKTSSSAVGHEGNNVYADHDGNVYKNSGSGWQQHTSSGWQSASASQSTQKEEQARSQGDEKYNNFQKSGGGEGASHPGGFGHSGGGGGWGGRSGGRR